jgi:hypothetical protein
MKVHIESLLELVFCPNPSNFGVEAHIKPPLELLLLCFPPLAFFFI